jgi:pathogenesis-related protein 1
MSKLVALLVVVVIVVLVSVVQCQVTRFTNSVEKQNIIDRHNLYRTQVKIPTKLVWDENLATSIANHYSKIATTFSGSMLPHSKIAKQGENIYAASAQSWGFDGVRATDSWASEKNYYTYGKFAVQSGSNAEWCNRNAPVSCGHYTQIVWENTTRVGCIKVLVPRASFKYHTICAYSPSGNVNGAGCTPSNKSTCYYPYIKR